MFFIRDSINLRYLSFVKDFPKNFYYCNCIEVLQLFVSENLVNCKKFAEHACLSYVLSALSCHDETLRALAYHTLARYYSHLEGRTKFKHRYQIIYMLNTIKNSLDNPNAKLPCVVTTFLARAAQLILKPGI